MSDPYLPPGCRVTDIPGNRPRDEARDRFEERLSDGWFADVRAALEPVLDDDLAFDVTDYLFSHVYSSDRKLGEDAVRLMESFRGWYESRLEDAMRDDPIGGGW